MKAITAEGWGSERRFWENLLVPSVTLISESGDLNSDMLEGCLLQVQRGH